MAHFTDQAGRKIDLNGKPGRIISTVPSQTELLYDLGLEKEVVGITAYCVHPPHWLKEKTVIGGTKDLQIEKIRKLQPDLILGNKEENVREQVEILEKDCAVWLSDVKSVEDALQMIMEVGTLTKTLPQAEEIISEINLNRKKYERGSFKTACYFIWRDPYMVAGGDTFISAMLKECGFINIFENSTERYPQVSLENLQALKPEQIFLSSEPYSFTTKDLHDIGQFLPTSNIAIVDGELFSWYGSRMIQAFKHFNNQYH